MSDEKNVVLTAMFFVKVLLKILLGETVLTICFDIIHVCIDCEIALYDCFDLKNYINEMLENLHV